MITHNMMAFHDYWNIDLHIDKIFADNIYILSVRDSYRCDGVLLLERYKKLNLKASLKKYLQDDSINWSHAYNRLNNIILTTWIIHNKYILYYICSYLKGLLAGYPVEQCIMGDVSERIVAVRMLRKNKNAINAIIYNIIFNRLLL